MTPEESDNIDEKIDKIQKESKEKLDTIKGLSDTLDKWKTRREALKGLGMKGDVSCDKCEGYIGYGWDAKRHEVKMAGDYFAVLCTPCRNTWGDFLNEDGTDANAAWKALQRVDVKIQATQLCHYSAGTDKVEGCDEALNKLMEEKDSIKLRIRAFAKEWLAVKPPQPAVAP